MATRNYFHHPTAVTDIAVANIRALRQERGWTTTDVGTHMADIGFPISRGYLTNRENKHTKSSMGVDELVAFATILGVTPQSLLIEPSACLHCGGLPPGGYTCNACGEGSGSRPRGAIPPSRGNGGKR
jgi:hypothetical protein